jgi:hypothetical protein
MPVSIESVVNDDSVAGWFCIADFPRRILKRKMLAVSPPFFSAAAKHQE